jgi:hypothetical protein
VVRIDLNSILIRVDSSKVDLTFDFGQMHDEAVRIEDTHGRDKGNGWLLKHPIRKLELYQEYTGMEPHIQY